MNYSVINNMCFMYKHTHIFRVLAFKNTVDKISGLLTAVIKTLYAQVHQKARRQNLLLSLNRDTWLMLPSTAGSN